MATKQTRMCGTPRRVRGQSIPLLALMIVVLVGMVALSVDVGRTFSEERRAVAAANAASLSAMNTYVRRPAGTTNTVIYDAIVNSLRSNGIDVENNPNIRMEAYYLNARGEPIEGGARITRDGTVAPDNVAYIQVNLEGDVDTFFARVVNQEQLPIAATAYAGTCPPTDGVYPIAINNEYISGNEFRNPGDANGDGRPDNNWERLTNGPYRGFTKMRLYLADNNVPGGFGWLRWLDGRGASGANANSAQELELALTGTGTLSRGFMEVVPWPATNLPRPANYPERPGELNVGDWVYGSSGFTASNDRRAALDAHIQNGTRMVLPIYDVAVSQGSNAAYRVVRFGLFVLTEYGRERNRPYMDFIFLGDPNRQGTACSATPPPPEDTSIVRLTGSVELWPEYQVVANERRPVQYVVVLDVSGSMSMDFFGRGYMNDQPVQCIVGHPGSPPPVEGCVGNYRHAWRPETERRIYVAKKAIQMLIDQTNMPGNTDYDPTRPPDQMALIWFNQSVPLTNRFGFSSDPAALKNAVLNAGKTRNITDPYLTSGFTNVAGALYRARELLQNAPKTTNHLGREWVYRRAIILVTDGVSNVFLDRSKPDLYSIPSSNGISSSGYPPTYVGNPTCGDLKMKVLDDAECQTTRIGGKYNNMDRPITQMVQQAEAIKADQSVQTDIYVLAISVTPPTGLKDGVATTRRHFYTAETLERGPDGLNNVDRIMLAINAEVEYGPCISGQDGEWRGIIPVYHFQSVGGLSYPNVGEVILQDISTNSVYRAPIVASTDGRVRYTFESIPRGTYRLQAYLFYRHPLDPPTAGPRMYSQIFNSVSSQSDMVVVLEPNGQGAGFITTIEQNLRLRLNGNVCAVN
ncbi:VWA domain-containing protein [uncultured Chloroflexus sp.]|uniref:VWA domain-containing protein n=3 Tax=uncultured Chloroflexus sp. TaxID=214040 RepID=UPI0026335239|nr:VWA domain-containing protein [uncultured Chloroflexus sp.]